MTTSVDFNSDEIPDDDAPAWTRDTIGRNVMDDGTRKYVISDETIEDGWIKSDTTLRLDKLQ